MLDFYRRVLLNTKNVERSSYIWNALYGIIFAMQSAILLIVITRTNSLDDAGVFSIAFAISGLLSFIADFGVRKYQVSDINEINSFTDYFSSRLLTCTAMIIACVIASIYGYVFRSYSVSKCLVIMMIGFVKLSESISDVFFGRFQQQGRLDIAAKTNSYRIIASMLCCIVALIITHDLLISCAIWAATSTIGVFIFILPLAKPFCKIKVKFIKAAQKRIIVECFPLFVGSFLLIYLGNAPKYAIDVYMNESAQACYNFIYMPVFVIGLLANFVFNPVLVDMSMAWDKGEHRIFNKIVLRQHLVIAGLTALAIAVAVTIGCPVLGWLYHTDLSAFRLELSILMIGGGMLALVNFYAVVVTVIRSQQLLTIGYIAVSAIAFLMSGKFVQGYGLMGAAVLYSVLMTLLAVAFAVILFISIRKKKASMKAGMTEGKKEEAN
ncbi:MAG: lipopolysaccharide biosynthesis protein [Firmicutes bacterium]|nr:lipopolysaccharide biosynthesis protein [Bacillota bacterium]